MIVFDKKGCLHNLTTLKMLNLSFKISLQWNTYLNTCVCMQEKEKKKNKKSRKRRRKKEEEKEEEEEGEELEEEKD